MAYVFSFYGETKPPKYYLRNKISESDQRYPTYLKAIELVRKCGGSVLVETGGVRSTPETFRSDGKSTLIFSHFAMDEGLEFYKVSINQGCLNSAKSRALNFCKKMSPDLHFVCSDPLEFFQNFEKRIDFLYLDSDGFDESNPLSSQHHHLLEITAAYPLLHEDSVVLIEDCALSQRGIGKLAIQFLVERGWRILESEYQVLLVYPK